MCSSQKDGTKFDVCGTHVHNGIQGLASEYFLGEIYPNNVKAVLLRRLQRILGSCFNPGSLDPALHLLSLMRPFEVMQVIKTWSNSWATTFRFHEAGRLPCLLGCPDEPDSLDHYAFCSRMQNIIAQCVAGSPPSPPAPIEPSSLELGSVGCRWNGTRNLGLDEPCRVNLQCVACMFYAYHTMKFTPDVKEAARGGLHTLDFTSLQQVFAGAFEAAFRFA